MRQAGEPSVEEILASIKKVIARDNRVETARRDPAANTQSVNAHSAGADAALRDRFDVLDLSEVAAQVLGAEPVADTGADSPLLSETTVSTMHDSLTALAMLSAPGVQPQIVRSGETSLESLVREMLRPMLAEWLDQHLPPLVDRLVAAEIARIVRKKA